MTDSNANQKKSFAVYLQPRVLVLFFMGFSSGLPLPLVYGTLTAWLNDEHIAKTSIGFFAWIGFAYSFKFVWAPVIDRINLPWLSQKMGRLRSWMLFAQIAIFISLITMSFMDPKQSLWGFALAAVVVAFGSATQDITVDAFRVQSMTEENKGPISANYMFGYRIALLVGSALALFLADLLPWREVYMLMACLMIVGMSTVLIVSEPTQIISKITQQLEDRWKNLFPFFNQLHPGTLKNIIEWFIVAVISPFLEFFSRYHWKSLVVIALILVYGISDRSMITMANPFYLDMGFTKTEIASVVKFFGFFMTIFGVIAGGYLIVKIGIMRTLLIGSILVALTNLLFALLTKYQELSMLAAVISADNFSGGMASAAFVAYLSSMTNKSYSATQYALFSSLMTMLGTLIAGFSGIIIDITGYVFFFSYVAVLGVPAVILIFILMKIANIDAEKQTAVT